MTESTPVVRRPAVERLCFCGKVFKAKPSDIENGRGKYCGIPCANRARSATFGEKAIPRVCKCGVKFTVLPCRAVQGKGIYCSNSCASKYKPRTKPQPKQVTCPCGVTFTRPNVRSTQSFCSDPCRLEKLKGGAGLSRPVHVGRDRSASSVFADLGHSGYVRCPRCSRERQRGARCACERQEMAS